MPEKSTSKRSRRSTPAGSTSTSSTDSSGSETAVEKSETDVRADGKNDTPGKPDKLVVVGSSAGGIQALSVLVSTLPKNFSASIVLAQHLDPLRTSNLTEILERRSSLPVVTVTDDIPLEKGRVYVVPANRHVVITDGHVALDTDPATQSSRPRPSIDLLLNSAARSYGERLIAIVLTGSGADGAAGAVEVKKAGGTVIIQNPQTAEYPSMPLALPPTAVDYVVDLENIGHILSDLLSDVALPQVESTQDDALQTLLNVVSRRSSIDFRQYKPTTILRRVGRRMAVTHNVTIEDYTEYIKANRDEVDELVKAFLIQVTEFFRDMEAFNYLRESVVPQLLAEAEQDKEYNLRLWSAGCATGEEPYSLALILADALGQDLSAWNIKIFATDVSDGAIEYARRGIYPENVLNNLPDDFKHRFFEKVDSGYRISKSLRQMVIFGQQDLSRGVPFPRIDLVVCRNLLIYFKADLQQQVLDKLAYSLHATHGYLFLGQAETVRPAQAQFQLVNKKWKVYKCLEGAFLTNGAGQTMTENQNSNLRGRRATVPALKSASRSRSTGDNSSAEAELANLRRFSELMLRTLPSGVAIIDRGYHTLSINAAARRLFNVREVIPEQDFLHAVHGLPYSRVRTAIDAAFRDQSTITLPELEIDDTAGVSGHFVTLTITAMDRSFTSVDLVMISVQDVTDTVIARQSLEAIENEQRQLLQDLQSTNHRLSDVNKELQDANEELQAANEELMLAQEELQATNEEFEATNEELQATNEELETNNEELQATNEELETTNEELTARSSELQELGRILAKDKAQIGEMVQLAPYHIMVLRGPHLIVEALNPRYQEFLGSNNVIGLPIHQVLTGPEQHRVITTLEMSYKSDKTQLIPKVPTTLQDAPGHLAEGVFNYIVVPIHDTDGKVDGLVMYGQDVTSQVAQEFEERREKLRMLVEHADQVALGLYDANTTELLYASPRYLESLQYAHGYEPETIIGRPVEELFFAGPGVDAVALFREVVREGTPRRLPEARIKLPDGTETVWDYSLTPIALTSTDQSGQIGYVVVSAIEITREVQVREELERVDRMKDLFLSAASHEMRTPLVPLVGYSDLLERIVAEHEGEEGWDKRINEYVGKFRGQLRQLRRLVDDLFDVVRISNGKFSFEKKPVDLREVVNEAVDETRMQNEKRKIKVEMPEDGPVMVEGDETRLVQVTSNLVHNAIKYSPDSKGVNVRLKKSGKEAVIEVQDFGRGIAEADLPSIFNHFYQADRPATDNDGLGLGLFIAKSIVAEHAGTITATSTVGKGSTFTVTIPLLKQE